MGRRDGETAKSLLNTYLIDFGVSYTLSLRMQDLCDTMILGNHLIQVHVPALTRTSSKPGVYAAIVRLIEIYHSLVVHIIAHVCKIPVDFYRTLILVQSRQAYPLKPSSSRFTSPALNCHSSGPRTENISPRLWVGTSDCPAATMRWYAYSSEVSRSGCVARRRSLMCRDRDDAVGSSGDDQSCGSLVEAASMTVSRKTLKGWFSCC